MLRPLAIVLALLPAPALAQQAPTLTMTGQAALSVAPEKTSLTGNVTENADSAVAAHAAATRRLDAFLAAAKRFGTATRSRVATGQARAEGKGLLRSDEPAFFSRGRVTVVLSDPDDLPEALDALARTDIDGTLSVFHDVADRAALLRGVREAAVTDAVTRAETYAAAAGVTLGPILDITESGASTATAMHDAAPASAGYSSYSKGAPTGGGGTRVSASVRIRWALEQ